MQVCPEDVMATEGVMSHDLFVVLKGMLEVEVRRHCFGSGSQL